MEITFSWGGEAGAAVPANVTAGVEVLRGATETTRVFVYSGAGALDDVRGSMTVDGRKSSTHSGGGRGSISTVPLDLGGHSGRTRAVPRDSEIALRVLVDRSVVEVFGMGGRAQVTALF
jgi:hypothetical protein